MAEHDNSRTELREEIRRVLNMHSAENRSDTPDFVLGRYLMNCLDAFDWATNDRKKWYEREKEAKVAEAIVFEFKEMREPVPWDSGQRPTMMDRIEVLARAPIQGGNHTIYSLWDGETDPDEQARAVANPRRT